MRNILLLTATIIPQPGIPKLVRVDPAVRTQDYVKALEFYVRLVGTAFDGIVFAENSGADLGAVREVASRAGVTDRIEFISFFGLDHPPSRGRGYGEFKLIDHAMQHSSLLRGDVCVWKCTGRYIITNLAELVRNRPDADIYCHCLNIPNRLCELYLMSFTRRGHTEFIIGIYEKLRNDLVPGVHSNEEVAFRELIDERPKNLIIQPRFNALPLLEAVRGHNNVSFHKKWHPKTLVRRLAQAFTPWVWL